MSDCQQSPPERWTVTELKHGHVYSSGRSGPHRDGYATCRLCGARENERAIIAPCPENPLMAAEAKLQAVPVQEDADLEGLIQGAVDHLGVWSDENWRGNRARVSPILRDFARRVREPLEKERDHAYACLKRAEPSLPMREAIHDRVDLTARGEAMLDLEELLDDPSWKGDDWLNVIARVKALLEAERKLAEVTQAKRDDEDASCRLEELRVAFGLPEGTPEEIASGINLMLDCKRDFVAEARRDTWEKAIKASCVDCEDGKAVEPGEYGHACHRYTENESTHLSICAASQLWAARASEESNTK